MVLAPRFTRRFRRSRRGALQTEVEREKAEIEREKALLAAAEQHAAKAEKATGTGRGRCEELMIFSCRICMVGQGVGK